jgi:hypothetical protein
VQCGHRVHKRSDIKLDTTSRKSVSRLEAPISQHIVFIEPLNGLARL